MIDKIKIKGFEYIFYAKNGDRQYYINSKEEKYPVDIQIINSSKCFYIYDNKHLVGIDFK
jgi:hypothetical protein